MSTATLEPIASATSLTSPATLANSVAVRVKVGIMAGKGWIKGQIVNGLELGRDLEEHLRRGHVELVDGVRKPYFPPTTDDLEDDIEELHEAKLSLEDQIDGLKALLKAEEAAHAKTKAAAEKENKACYDLIERLEGEIRTLKVAALRARGGEVESMPPTFGHVVSPQQLSGEAGANAAANSPSPTIERADGSAEAAMPRRGRGRPPRQPQPRIETPVATIGDFLASPANAPPLVNTSSPTVNEGEAAVAATTESMDEV